MSLYTVRRWYTYRAELRLVGVEEWASNIYIRDQFRTAGFSDVLVWGSGNRRTAQGKWMKPDASAILPAQVVKVHETAPVMGPPRPQNL